MKGAPVTRVFSRVRASLGQIRDIQGRTLIDGMRANRLLDRCFADAEAGHRLEPLPLLGHQADQRNRRVAQLPGQHDHVVKRNLGSGIENIIEAKLFQADWIGNQCRHLGHKPLD